VQRLTQVLLNLVGNAIKFTDTGEVCITATAVDGHFAVGVTDTGPGIPPKQQARIFEQFHQVDNSNTEAKGGTGLGLAIANQIIEMHGGRSRRCGIAGSSWPMSNWRYARGPSERRSCSTMQTERLTQRHGSGSMSPNVST
jgi:light-regulated signal transduction histidine kinase (bacteriophytochrome)